MFFQASFAREVSKHIESSASLHRDIPRSMARISSMGAVAAIFYGVVSIGSTLLTVTHAQHCLPRPHIDPSISPSDSTHKHSTPTQSQISHYEAKHLDEDSLIHP